MVSPDGEKVFFSTGRGGTVIVLDVQNHPLLNAIKVGARLRGAISPDGALPSRGIQKRAGPVLQALGCILATGDLGQSCEFGFGKGARKQGRVVSCPQLIVQDSSRIGHPAVCPVGVIPVLGSRACCRANHQGLRQIGLEEISVCSIGTPLVIDAIHPPPRSDHIPRGGFPAGGSPQAGLIQRNVKILHEYRTRRKSSRAGFGKPFRDESTGLFGHGQVGGCAPVGRKCERRRGLGPEGGDSQAQEKERPEPTRTRPSVGIFRRTPAFATVRVHRLGARLVQRCAIFFKRAVVDLPATTGRMITRPPACSTAARSA